MSATKSCLVEINPKFFEESNSWPCLCW